MGKLQDGVVRLVMGLVWVGSHLAWSEGVEVCEYKVIFYALFTDIVHMYILDVVPWLWSRSSLVGDDDDDDCDYDDDDDDNAVSNLARAHLAALTQSNTYVEGFVFLRIFMVRANTRLKCNVIDIDQCSQSH